MAADAEKLDARGRIPVGVKGVKFTMLREQHFQKAREFWGTDDFDRLFVVRALHPPLRQELGPRLAPHRIHLLTAEELVRDLAGWYRKHPRPAALRHSLIGDLLHLLVGFCRFELPALD